MSKQSHGSDGSLGSDQEEDYDERRHRNRERNKEHARKTRVRKKEQLQALKSRVNELEEEGMRLKQSIQDSSVASILLGLSTGAAAGGTGRGEKDGILSSASSSPKNFGACLAGGKRKRFLSLDGEDPSPPPMELNIKGQITLVGGPSNEGKANINWKTGVYVDETGKRQQLTKSELETLRRERNRMHAKMTRDRKKCFIASLKRVISRLEDENQILRETLEGSQTDGVLLASEEKSNGDEVYSSSFTSESINQSNTSMSMFSSNMEEKKKGDEVYSSSFTPGNQNSTYTSMFSLNTEEKKMGDEVYSSSFTPGSINQSNTATSASMFSPNMEDKKKGDEVYSSSFTPGSINQSYTSTSKFSSNIYTVG